MFTPEYFLGSSYYVDIGYITTESSLLPICVGSSAMKEWPKWVRPKMLLLHACGYQLPLNTYSQKINISTLHSVALGFFGVSFLASGFWLHSVKVQDERLEWSRMVIPTPSLLPCWVVLDYRSVYQRSLLCLLPLPQCCLWSTGGEAAQCCSTPRCLNLNSPFPLQLSF